MGKKTKIGKCSRRPLWSRAVGILLSITMALSLISGGGAGDTGNMQKAEAASASEIFGTAYSLASGVMNATQSYQLMLKRNNGKMSVSDVFSAIFSDPSQLKMEYMLEDIYSEVGKIDNKVDKLDEKLDYITDQNEKMNRKLNGKLDTLNQKLDRQTRTLAQITGTLNSVLKQQTSISNQISGVEETVVSQINAQTGALTVALYNSTNEIKNVSALLNSISAFYASFDGLSTSEQTILKDLQNKQADYSNLLEEINKLENASDVMRVLEKISLNYRKAYASLSEAEQALLETKVTVLGGSEMTINKFLADYMESMYTYMTKNIYEKASGYKSDFYDTSIYMGSYILGNEISTGNVPIGEIYYQLAMSKYATSDEVHMAYMDFRDSILQQYYTTAYLCQMSLLYKIAYEKENNGNSSTISNDQKHLEALADQMEQVYAYADFELKNCRQKYDFNDYIDSEYNSYLCYYGNSLNAEKGIKNWKCVPKKDVYISGALSESRLTLCVGEAYSLRLYYGMNDVTDSAVFRSSDTGVAVVEQDGTVCAVSTGDAVITAVFDGKEYHCNVAVSSNLAIPNGTKESVYHYGSGKYSVKADVGYDYYYNAVGYTADMVTLSGEKTSIGIEEVSGLKEADLKQFSFITLTSGVAQVKNNQIYAVDKGMTAVCGYRYLQEEDQYEYIGIPVASELDLSGSMDKDAEIDKKKDYSEYEKISSAEDLIALANSPDKWGADKKYVLTNNIDLRGMEWSASIGYMYGIGEKTPGKKGTTTSRFGTSGSVSGSAFVPFCGEFDGNGYTISNFTITDIQNQDKYAPVLEQITKKYDALTGNKWNVVCHQDLQMVAVGLFGATQNADIYNLNVMDADISLELSDNYSISCDGGQYQLTLKYDDKTPSVGLYTGAMIGYAANKTDFSIEETLCNVYQAASYEDLTNDIKAYPLTREALDTYAAFMPEDLRCAIAGAGAEEQFSALYLYLTEYYASETSDRYIDNCYAAGSIHTKVNKNAGNCYAGMLAGCAENCIKNCKTAGTISCESQAGAGGGLLGKWEIHTSYLLTGCTSEVTVNMTGGCAAGGLIGEANESSTTHPSMFHVTEADLKPIVEGQISYVYARYFAYMLTSALSDYGQVLSYDDQNLNAALKDCQVLGNVSGDGTAGGLIGVKTGAHRANKAQVKIDVVNGEPQWKTYNDITFYNLDISNCYVVSNINTKGSYAGGLIGQDTLSKDADTYVPVNDDTTKETKTIKRGSLKRCYYYGTLTSTAAAAGIIGNVEYDAMDVSDIIVVPYTVTVTASNREEPLIAPALFSDDTTTACIKAEQNTIYYYNTPLHKQFIRTNKGVTANGADDKAIGIAKDNKALSDRKTYQELWPEAFLELKVEIDTESGIIPTYLSNRYHFPIDQARRYYIVGDTFEPVTQVNVNDGLVSRVVTEGVTSTAPDMNQPGVRQVTVQYGDYKEQYIVYIYPKQNSYIKVTSLPELSESDAGQMTLKGGKVTIYNNKDERVAEQNISDCKVTISKDGTKYIISYGKLTTCISIVTLSVYSNGLETESKELRDRMHYIEGTKLNKKDVLQETLQLTNGDKKLSYKLLGSSLSTDIFTIDSDMNILTLYMHEHKYAAAWKTNAQYHWHPSTCGHTDAVKGKAAHTFGAWKVTKAATKTAQGEKERTCICGYKQKAVIPKLDGKTNPDTPNQPVPSSDQETKKLISSVNKKLGVSKKTAEKIVNYAKKNNISTSILLTTSKTICKQKSEDVKGAEFRTLSAKAGKTTKSKIGISWNKVKGADGYIVFGSKCGTKNKYTKLKDVGNKTSYTQNKRKKGTYNKYVVIAYKKIDGKKITIAASKTVHQTTTGGKYGNPAKLKLNKTKVTIKKGKKYTLKASVVKKDKKIKVHRGISYESSNPKVASVSSKGKITAKKKGKCTIYVYAQNGVYKKVTVYVK